MPEPMTEYEIGAYRDAYNELRVAAESRRVEMMDEDATVSNEEASVRAALEAGATVVASLRADLAQRREGVIAVCAHCGVSVGSDRTIEDGIVTHSRKETCISLLKSQRADRDALATAQREAAGLREALTHEDIKLAWVTQGHPEFGIECTICIGDECETLTNQSDPITALINTSKAVRAKFTPAPEAGR